MKSAETLLPTENQPVMRIARVVPVAPIPVPELAEKLRGGIPIERIFLSEVLLIQKSTNSNPSAGLVMPPGGEIDSEESAFAGGLREIGEETTLLSLAQGEAKQAWNTNPFHPSFTFGIPGYNAPRELQMFVLPVASRSFSVHKPREGKNGSEDKIERIVSFSPKELEQLIDKGSLERGRKIIRAAGHFTAIDDNSISISGVNKAMRRTVLNGITEDVRAFEARLRETMLGEVNRVRWAKQTALARDLSICSQDELIRAFVAAQMRLGLAGERQREINRASQPPDKADLLKVANYLAAEELPTEIFPELLLSTPTHEALRAVIRLEKSFRKGAETIITETGDPSATLQDSWPKVLGLPPTQRVELIKRANEAMIQELSRQTGVSRENIGKALETTEEFHDFITRSLQRQRDLKEGVFQEFRPMNEISNSTLFTRVIFALGLHPNIPIARSQDGLRILRFEAIRDLAVFSAALEVTQKLQEADNNLFQSALDTMFSFPPQREYVNLGDGRLHPVYHRTTAVEVAGRKLHVITDERLKKTPLSAVSFGMGNPELNDIYSVNFVLADDNFDDHNPLEQRLKATQNFRETLLSHIQQELNKDPLSGWEVSVQDGTYKRTSLDRVDSFMRSGSNESEEMIAKENGGGKRPGSKGNAIAREKFVISLQNSNGQTQLIEVCIYPFESTHTQSVAQLGKAGFWGFAEKLEDDFKGNYEAMRILARDRENPTEASLYELLYPGHLYEIISQRMMDKHVKPRKNRKG
ncbi:hypothetical protein M1615_01320 [Patescibacteria group bacterium]|nr:hypothetical protein [Patescibacteria group bacterium]